MRIKFKNTPEQLELISKMGSANKAEALAAQETFAQLLGPTVGERFLQADTSSFLFRNFEFSGDQDPSLPADLFAGINDGLFTVFSQSIPGGLPSNSFHLPTEEIKFTTYRLDGVVDFLAKHARMSRLPVIQKAIEQLVQQILVKTQNNAWAVVLAAIAGAEHNGKGHVFKSSAAGKFSLDDFNKLQTAFRRINRAWTGGTPVGGVSRPTDIIVSPETMEKLRSMSYNPINTTGANGTVATAATGSVTLPDEERRKMFASAGVPEFYGVNVVELLELGKSEAYNVIFGEIFGNKNLESLDAGTAASGTFDAAANDLIIAVDGSKDFAYRAIQTDAENGSALSLQPDDQFTQRSGKIGFYGATQQGHMVLDTRPAVALVI